MKQVKRHLETLNLWDLDALTVGEFIEQLQAHPKDAQFDVWEVSEVRVFTMRDQSPQEVASELDRLRIAKELQEKQDKETYLRLKEQFE